MTEPCNHWVGPTETGSACGAPSIGRYLPGHRCAPHTPAALNGRPENTPDPNMDLNAMRARAGIPVYAVPPASASRLMDDRAIASGKRRSSPGVYAAARQRLAK